MHDASCMLSLSAHQHSHAAALGSRCSLQVLLSKEQASCGCNSIVSAYTGNSSVFFFS